MKHIVITGSTRGIGFGLALEFLQLGCKVTINGRSHESVNHGLNSLKGNFPDNVQGFPAAVENRDELETLWESAEKQFGKIDIWINNAGIDQVAKVFLGIECR